MTDLDNATHLVMSCVETKQVIKISMDDVTKVPQQMAFFRENNEEHGEILLTPCASEQEADELFASI